MSFKSLLLSFRLIEILYSALLIGLLTGLSIYYYRPYVLNAYALNTLYSLYDLRTHIAIDMAHTGLPQGSSDISDYSHIMGGEGAHVQNVKVTKQGHVLADARVAYRQFFQNAVHKSIEGKSAVLFRTVNNQGAYVFHSWQCNPKGNQAPFMSDQSDQESSKNKLVYTIYCNGNKL